MWGNLTKINVASYLLFFFRVHLFWRKKIISYHWESFSIKKKLCLSVNSTWKKDIWMRIFFFLSTSHKHNVSSKWAKFHIHSFMNTIIYCVTCVIANPIYFHQKFCGIFCSWFYWNKKELLSTYCAMRIHSEQDKNQTVLEKKNNGNKQKKGHYEIGQSFFFVMIQLHAE